MRSGVPSSRITRAEPSICIVSRSNGSLSQQISSFCPSSAPASMAPRSWYGTSSLFSLRRPIRALLFGNASEPGRWPADQVRRAAVERDMEFGIGKARALNNRLEITGNKSLDLTQTRDAHGLKILLEEGASSVRVLRLQVYGFAADVPQRAMDRSVVVGTRSFA